MRKLDLNLFDTHVGIWQASAADPTLKTEIFDGLLKLFRHNGWKVTADPRILKYHRCLSPTHRLAARGDLRAEIEVSGCVVKIEFWSEAARQDNPNGRRYDFQKRRRAPYLDRVRIDLETRRIIAWLRERADVTEKRKDKRPVGRGPGCVSAAEAIARSYAESWHVDPALGRPRYDHYGQKSADGGLIEHGSRVWFRDAKGRIGYGTAYYRGGQGWMVTPGPYALHHASNFEIWTRQPADLRRKRNERERRKRLEAGLAVAIRAMNFGRAETLRAILFGRELTYGIWAKDKDAFYCPNYSGYTADGISAGRYTWDEAVAEVRRVPGELRLVLPSGLHLTAAELSTARAA